MRKEIGLPAPVSYPGLRRGDASQGLGPWAPLVFSGESEEAGQSWVRGLFLGTRRGCPDPWRGIWAWTFHVPLCHSWDMGLEAASTLGRSGPRGLLCHIWSRVQGASCLCWLMEIWSHVAAAAAKSLQSCPNPVQPHRWQPTRLLCPWDSPGKNTGVGCHFLLQCMRVKTESEVAQLCPTLHDPMDCSPPGSSVHGIFQARVLEWGAIAFSMSSG